MNDPPIYRTFPQVFATELEEIKERRGKAGLTQGLTSPAKAVDDGDEALQDRAGLALSGGGVRSASFSLGFLQALYRRGVLRQFDLLSTVSGGGYIAGFLASLVCHPESAVDFTTEDPTAGRGDGGPPRRPAEKAAAVEKPAAEQEPAAKTGGGRYDLLPTRTGRQPSAVRRMIHGGMYLRRPMLFVNRYLFGIVAINAMVLCGVASVAALAAWVFRFWDGTAPRSVFGLEVEPRTLAAAFGFNGDVRLAFLWTVLLLIAWLAVWTGRIMAEWLAERMAVAPEDRRIVHVLSAGTKLLCWMTLLSIPMGVVTLLATGEISFGGPPGSEPNEGLVSSISRSLGTLLLAGQVLAMLPFLKYASLIRSGTDPESSVRDQVIFKVAACGLIFGLPLSLFYLFVKEDISGVVRNRDEIRPGVALIDHHASQLISQSDIRDWAGFWRTMQAWGGDSIVGGGEPKDDPLLATWKSLEPSTAGATTPWSVVSRWTASWAGPGKAEIPSEFGAAARVLVAAAEQQGAVPRGVAGSDGQATRSTLQRSVGTHLALQEMQENLYLTGRFGYDSASGGWQLRRLYELGQNARRHKSEVVDRVNRYVLSDPRFFSAFESFNAATRAENALPPGVKPAEIVALRERGRGLKRAFDDLLAKDGQRLRRGAKGFSPPPEDAEQRGVAGIAASKLDSVGEVVELLDRVSSDELDRLARADAEQEAVRRFWRLIREIQLNNRRLLTAYAAGKVVPEQTVFAYVVHARDQDARLRYASAFAIAFLLLAITVSLNATSAHAAYRESIASMWIVGRGPGEGETRLADLDTSERGAPYLLVNATAHMPARADLIQRLLRRPSATEDELAENRTGFSRYLLSSRHCGCERTGFVNTGRAGTYRTLALADAVTLSGSAVTPELSRGFLARALMTMTNLRLGQRLPNPARCAPGGGRVGLPRYVSRPTYMTNLIDRAFWPPERRSFVMLSDGGHYENLGVEALLLRRTRVIVAVDAGEDGKNRLEDLFKLVRRCRAMYGIRIYTPADGSGRSEDGGGPGHREKRFLDTEVRRVRPKGKGAAGKSGRDAKDETPEKGTAAEDHDEAEDLDEAERRLLAGRHFFVARIEYPPVGEMCEMYRAGGESNHEADETSLRHAGPTVHCGDADGYLIYVKPTFTGDEEADLAGYRRTNSVFPHDPTVDQFYDQRRFESYRQLGEHIGEDLVAALYAGCRSIPEANEPWLANWSPCGERVLAAEIPDLKSEEPDTGDGAAPVSDAASWATASEGPNPHASPKPMSDLFDVLMKGPPGGTTSATALKLSKRIEKLFDGCRSSNPKQARAAFTKFVKALPQKHRVLIRKRLFEALERESFADHRVRILFAFRCFPRKDDRQVLGDLNEIRERVLLTVSETRILDRVRTRLRSRMGQKPGQPR